MQKSKHNHLTNEFLVKHFANQFDLVKAAIQRAESMVGTGFDGVDNITTVVLGTMENELRAQDAQKDIA
jgi:hypothetical protein